MALPTGTLTGAAGVDAFLAANHAVGAAERDATHAAAAEVLLHFADQVELHALVLRLDFDGVVDRRQLVFGEFDVERRADHLRDVPDALCVEEDCRSAADEVAWRRLLEP